MLLAAKVRQAADSLRRRGIGRCVKGLALEPEMKGFAGELSGLVAIPMKEVPHFPPALSPLRNRKVLYGDLDGEPVVVLEGRAGLHEGYFHREISFPLRVLASLGVRKLVCATSVLSLGPAVAAGDIVLIDDHIDLTVGSTLRGFQPSPAIMPVPPEGFYAKGLKEKAVDIAGKQGVELKSAVAALINGPAGPTPAECRMLKGFGATVVSMTLAAEAATAFQLGLEFVAVGVVRESATSWGAGALAYFRELLNEV